MAKEDYKETMGIIRDMRDDLQELIDEFSQHYWCNHTDKLEKFQQLLAKLNDVDNIVFANRPKEA